MIKSGSQIVIIFFLFLLIAGCGGASDNSHGAYTSTNGNGNTAPLDLTISANSTEIVRGETVSFQVEATDYSYIQCDQNADGSYDFTSYAISQTFTQTYQTAGRYLVNCRLTDSTGTSTLKSAHVEINVSLHTLGEVFLTRPYPEGFLYISDIYYDLAGSAFHVLAFPDSTSTESYIIKIDQHYGDILEAIKLVNPPLFINQSSEFTRVGDFYYITSYGWANGVAQSFVYEVDMAGNIISIFPCPAATADGFCEGITWDGQYLWSGASDNKNLTQYDVYGNFIQSIPGAWNTISIDDIGFIGGLVVLKDLHLYERDNISGQFGAGINIQNGYKGDPFGSYFFAANNSTLKIEMIYTGLITVANAGNAQ